MKELKFTDEIIINSAEVQNWLKQFNKDEEDKEIAIKILKQLRIFTISDLRLFIKEQTTILIEKLSINEAKLAIYPIIKFNRKKDDLWVPFDENKNNFKICDRKPQGNGSEDLVINIIHDLCKSKNSLLLESPDIESLRQNKVKNIIFVVDNSISGNQICDYLERFFYNKTIKSHWAYNYFKITILSFYLSEKAKERIKSNKFIANKIKSNPDCVKFKHLLGESMWEDFQDIEYLINKYDNINKRYRFGYDGSASNVIFEQSVPNNIFGIFYCKGKNNWNPLFPDRRISNELFGMLNDGNKHEYSEIPETHLKTLHYIHQNSNTLKKISLKIGFSEQYTEIICNWLIKIKLVELTNTKKYYKLTSLGKEYFNKNRKNLNTIDSFNFEIYTPKNMERHDSLAREDKGFPF